MATDCVSVTIDGFPDYLHKLSLRERPAIPSPKRQIDKTDVKGRMGSLYQKYAYEDMTFTLPFNYLEDVDDYQAFKEKFYIVRNWLNQATWLQFSDEPNIKYIVQTLDIGDAENDIIEYGEFDVTVTCKPFGRVIEDEGIIQENPTEFQILNNSLHDSFPIIKFVPKTKTCNFVLNEVTFSFENLTIGREITVDSDLMMVYEAQSDGDNLDRSNNMLTLQYPVLNPEINTFICTDISRIEIFRNALR